MAAPHRPDDPAAGDPTDSAPTPDDDSPRVLRLRLAPWDVSVTVAMLAALAVAAATTGWRSALFGYLDDVCTDETCAPVPYGLDYYIYPLVWGGIGAAVAAAVIGPLVSLLKGWYMSFWPPLALALVMLTSVAGAALTAVSQHFWR